MNQAERQRQYPLVEIGSAVSSFWIISILMVFINKHLLDTSATAFNLLLFVSWFQCFIAVSSCLTVGLIFRYLKRPSFFNLDVREMRAVGKLSLVLVFMIVTNNLCLKYVSVAFYYVSRSLSTFFTILLSYVMFGQTAGCRSMFCCALIIIGYAMGVFEEGAVSTVSQTGVAWGVVSSAAAALYCVVMDSTVRSLERIKTSENSQRDALNASEVRWAITFNTNLNVTIFCLPIVLVSGSPHAMYKSLLMQSGSFWFILILSGVLAVAVTYVTSWQVQVTSAITHNVSGTAKNCTQTVLGCVIYNEVRSAVWWLSNVVVAIGSLGYVFARQYESANVKAEAQRAAEALQAQKSEALEKVLIHSASTVATESTTNFDTTKDASA